MFVFLSCEIDTWEEGPHINRGDDGDCQQILVHTIPVDKMSDYLEIDLKTYCAYHFQTGGAVEQDNGTIKIKLAEVCEETGLSWVKVLP